MDKLDIYQMKVVQSSPHANIKVVGAPGSGKTKTLVERYIHLYRHENFDPERILVVTYSKQAATEMLNRIENYVDLTRKARYNISTINAFCYRSYNAWRLKTGQTQLKVWEFGDSAINPAYKAAELLLEYAGTNDMSLFDTVNKKLSSIPEPTIKTLTDLGVNPEKANQLFETWRQYQVWMKENNLVDYYGQLWNIDRLITLNHVFKMMTGGRYDKIMCDEGQDMFAQTYRILLALAESSSFEIYGDPSQSVYGFNGAAPHMLDNLEDTIEGMETFHLRNNYRSHRSIVQLANVFGPKTTAKFEKMNCVKSDQPGSITVASVPRMADQADYIASEIKAHSMNFDDVYVLARTNGQCALIHQRLTELGIPNHYAGKYSIWDKSHMKAGLGYMSMVKDQDTSEDLLSVLNIPSEDYTSVFGSSKGQYTPTRFLSKNAFQGTKLGDLISGLFQPKRSQYPGIKNLIGFVDYLKNVEDDRGRVADIQGSITKSAQYSGQDYAAVEDDLSILWDKLENLDYSPDAMRNYIQQTKENRRKVSKTSGKVKVMTIHGAKGLEAKFVFLTGLSQPSGDNGAGFHPGRNSNPIINEENCLYYVAISRAIEKLYLTWYHISNGVDYIISDFVDRELIRMILDGETQRE